MNRSKRYLLSAAVIVTATVLAGCGSKTDKSTTASTNVPPSSTAPSPGATSAATAATPAHNAVDTAFAQDMIVHHRGAIDMAKLAATRADKAGVKKLASAIEAAQQPEIDAMSGWLKTWGESAPKADAMTGMDHGSETSAMPGMMTDQEMKQLEGAKGAAFDTMFLEMMIRHHEGAIAMSEEETSKGADTDAKALATKIIADQTAEIATMRQLLT